MGGEVKAVTLLFSSYACGLEGERKNTELLGPLILDVEPKSGASIYGEEEGGSISVRLDTGIVSSLIILQHKTLIFYLLFFNFHFYLISE